MEVWFRDDTLRRCYEHHKEAAKRWNEKVARRYVQRINILRACQSMADLSTFPQLRFQPLKGRMQGRYAIMLDGFWRLILSFDKADQRVCVEEVSKHYDD